DRTVGEKRPRALDEEGGVSLKELSGYNSKRGEFEIEYDNDAEHLLADMEFRDTDSKAERNVKLQILKIYAKRLDERKRRRNFILDRNLLSCPDPFERGLTREEQEACRQYRVFMRFNSLEEHRDLLNSIVDHMRIAKRIQDLQEARAAGCRTSAAAGRYIDQKTKGENGDDSSQKPTRQNVAGEEERWCVAGFPGAELLSETEKEMCEEMRILPTHYMDIMETISMGIIKGSITDKDDAHLLPLHVDPNKIDRIYDALIAK
ncbi:hypothetical protein M569_17626, partial [Genlisea aurea]